VAGTTLTPEELEAKVCHDEFKLVGDYVAGRGFVDPDLDALLKHYCELDKVDVTKSDANGMPLWLSAWQSRVPGIEAWSTQTQGRAGVAEAFLRWYFRGQCKKAGLAYAEACDEFFAELFKSSINGQAGDFAKGVTWVPQDPPAALPKTAQPPVPHEAPAKFDETNALPLDPPKPKPAPAAETKPAASGSTPAATTTAPASGPSTSPLYNPPPPQNELERRMRAAWHSARIEIDRGFKKYGDGKWTTGPNSGPLIDPYQKAAYVDPKGYAASPWCGIFQGWNYRKAGIKADETIDKKLSITGSPSKRVIVFWSTLRLKYYWEAAKTQTMKFPYENQGKWKRDDCVKFLKEKFNAFKPIPGDILLVNTHVPLSHVAMVGGYDPDTFQLITYEGNCGDKAAAHIWDLASPDIHGFFRVNHIGRMLESDFGDPGEVQPEGPSPDPKIYGATSATGRYGG